MITEYCGDYNFLAADYPTTVTYHGYVWGSVEHALLGSMYDDPLMRKALSELTPMSAKHVASNLEDKASKDWDKEKHMNDITRLKFIQNKKLQEKLVKITDDIGGPYGKILMDYRKEISPEVETLLLSSPDIDIHDRSDVLENLAHKNVKVETLPDIGAISISGNSKDLAKLIKALPKNLNITTEKKEAQVSAL